MSLLDAQEWLNQQADNNQSLYAVMVQYEIGEDTEYRLINAGSLGLYPTTLISHAVWMGYSFTYFTAKQLIGKTIFTETDEYEITRAFIVKKENGYRIVKEMAPRPGTA